MFKFFTITLVKVIQVINIIYHYTNKALSGHVSRFRCPISRLKMSLHATVPTKNTMFLSILFFLRFFILRIPRHLLFLSFCVYCRRFPMLTLRCRFAFLSYTAISHSCCMPVAWFCVSFLSREKKTWKTMRWCYCSMLWRTSGSF